MRQLQKSTFGLMQLPRIGMKAYAIKLKLHLVFS